VAAGRDGAGVREGVRASPGGHARSGAYAIQHRRARYSASYLRRAHAGRPPHRDKRSLLVLGA